MTLEEHISFNFAGRSVVLVGNAAFVSNEAAFIDEHEIVVRFNLFNCKPGFREGFRGRRITTWCVNLDRHHYKERTAACQTAKGMNNQTIVVTPFQNDRRDRLPALQRFLDEHGLLLCSPAHTLGHPLRLKPRQQPSVGFSLAYRLLRQRVPITVIGFAGQTSWRHDGPQEIAFLQNHQLVDFRHIDAAARVEHSGLL